MPKINIKTQDLQRHALPYLLPRRDHQYGLHLEDVYLELSTFPDLKSNPGPFDLEPIALTAIPPCIGCLSAFFQMKQAKKKLIPEFFVGFGVGHNI